MCILAVCNMTKLTGCFLFFVFFFLFTIPFAVEKQQQQWKTRDKKGNIHTIKFFVKKRIKSGTKKRKEHRKLFKKKPVGKKKGTK